MKTVRGISKFIIALTLIMSLNFRQLTFAAGAQPKSSWNNDWTLTPWPDEIRITYPGTGISSLVKEPAKIPPYAMIEILSEEKNLKLKHSSGSTTELSGPGIYHLTEAYLNKKPLHSRTSMDETASNIINEDSKEKDSFERLISFFVPRVPFANNIPNRVTGPNEKTTFPIRPLYPPPVHFIETNTLPVQIGIEWLNEQGQVNPHSVYLWQESRFVHAPAAVVHGQKAFISLNRFGRYYWQIEDASTNFVSSPRTIIVRRIGADENTETKTASTDQMKQQPIGMALDSPTHRTHFFGCNISKSKPVSVPVAIHLKPSSFRQLSVTLAPNGSHEPVQVEIQPNQRKIETKLNISSQGSFEIRSKLDRILGNETIPLSIAQIQVTDLCNNITESMTASEIGAILDNGEVLPVRGSLDFTPLANERYRK
jgi:hypothetical protein